MNVEAFEFFAILFTGLALAPAAANVLAMPNKLALSIDDYMSAQRPYSSWPLMLAVWLGALVADFALFMAAAEENVPAAMIGLLAVAAAFGIFLMWTLPVNNITVNWTSRPTEWPGARTRWEYSQAAIAGCLVIALISVTLASI